MALEKLQERQSVGSDIRVSGEEKRTQSKKETSNEVWLNKIQFQRLREPLEKNSNFLLFSDRILSEVASHGLEFVLNEKKTKPTNYSNDEIELITGKVRNFIIQNISDNLHSQVRTVKNPKELLLKLEKLIDSSGIGSVYELYKRFNELLYNPKNESALEFNNRFDVLAERIRRRKHLELEEEKRNYLFAVEKYAPSILQREKNQYQINRTGLTIEELKEALIEEEDKDKETQRRLEENEASSAMYTGKRNNRPFRKPTCTGCGYAPDNHTIMNCPNKGKIYCYGCEKYTNHIRKNCPQEKHGKMNVNDRQSTTNPGKPGSRPAGATSGLKRGKLRRLPLVKAEKIYNQRRKAGSANIVFHLEDENTNFAWVDIDQLDADEYEYAINNEQEEATAMVTYEGKNLFNNCNFIEFVIDCASTDHIVNVLDHFLQEK